MKFPKVPMWLRHPIASMAFHTIEYDMAKNYWEQQRFNDMMKRYEESKRSLK